MGFVKIGLVLMPGDNDTNNYGERPESMIVV